jgi:hypothetical protein
MNILTEREKTHGNFEDVARVAQDFKTTIWAMQETHGLPWLYKESLEMICTKIARIVCGDCTEIDHWRDIIGYAQLSINNIEKEVPGNPVNKETPDEMPDPSVGDYWDYIPPNYR